MHFQRAIPLLLRPNFHWIRAEGTDDLFFFDKESM
jgi:hypothetical protein